MVLMKISPAATVTTFLFSILFQSVCLSQTVDPYAEARDRDSAMQSYHAVQSAHSATPDADAALTPDVVIQLLQSQPALKLQVKRVLIQKALDQGRLLAEEDLGDSELFALIRDDLNVRKIASDEIEKRHYIGLRPTDEEAFAARINQRRLARLEASEERRQDQRQIEEQQDESGAQNPPLMRAGAQPPAPAPAPQPAPGIDIGPSTLSPEDRNLERISPSDLPQLLTASAAMGGSSGAGSGMGGLSGRSSTSPESTLLVPSITAE